MWDVLWTDPDRELVGEHRAKKDKSKTLMKTSSISSNNNNSNNTAVTSSAPAVTTLDETGPHDLSRHPTTTTKRSSMSTRSSFSSGDSPFSFLRSRAARHASASASSAKRTGGGGNNSKLKSSASSSLASPVNLLSSCPSPLSQACERNSRSQTRAANHDTAESIAFDARSDISRATQTSPVLGKLLDCEVSSNVSCHDSVFSTREPDSDAITANSIPDRVSSEHGKPSSLVQALGVSSFITKQTEVFTSPRSAVFGDEHEVSTQILITSDATTSGSNAASSSPNDISLPLPSDDRETSTKPTPPAKSPLRAVSKRWSSPLKHHDPEAWRPPDEWECAPSDRKAPPTLNALTLSPSLPVTPNGAVNPSSSSSIANDVSLVQCEVNRMAAAGPDIVLSRLKEGWKTTPDTALHEEVHMEKKRWMLSTLHHLDLVRDPEPAQESMISPDRVNNLLALYESPSTISYLASYYNTAQIYHLSTSPSTTPGIHPLPVPSVSGHAFPIAPGMFDLVYCLTLPSLCPSPSILAILRNAHKALRPGGVLRLALIDPLPHADTLGKHLRAWLEEHLVVNLEHDFRCLSPTRLFSRWLGQVSLRGQGSAVMAAKFFAMPESVYVDRRVDPDARVEAARRLSETKAELRALVGRMLWLETWGRYINADKMWWEDAVCVNECLEMGTFWQYQIIEGVKET